MMRVTFAICCFNERQNISALLGHLATLHPRRDQQFQCMVASDECRDGTDDIVRQRISDFPYPLVLRTSPTRRGKASAVNEIIEFCHDQDIIILISADALPAPDCISRLLERLRELDVGVVAARAIPLGPKGNLAVALTHYLFELHHHIASVSAKSTEISAFRNPRARIPEQTLVDEAEIEYLLHTQGFRIVYEPSAVIYLNAPLSLRDYVSQRTSVTLGHLRLKARTGYRVETLSVVARVAAAWRGTRGWCGWLVILPVALIAESIIFALALIRQRWNLGDTARWARSHSTKRPLNLPCVK